MEYPSPSITLLLQAWRDGDAAALDQLMPLIYGELRRVAGAYVARHGSPLQPTEVVNEVFKRLIERDQVAWSDRAHFFAFCATMIRNILVDHFRRHRRQISLSQAEQLPQEQEVDLLKLHEALESLAEIDRRGSQVVELKFFGGLSFEEVAEVLGISIATAKRDWQKARAWLYHELSGRQ